MFSIFDPYSNLSSSCGYNSSSYYILQSVQSLELTNPTVGTDIRVELGSIIHEAILRFANISNNYAISMKFMDSSIHVCLYVYKYIYIYMWILYIYIYKPWIDR